jgi:hypothetical protein
VMLIEQGASCLVHAGGPSSEYALILRLDQTLAARRVTQHATKAAFQQVTFWPFINGKRRLPTHMSLCAFVTR